MCAWIRRISSTLSASPIRSLIAASSCAEESRNVMSWSANGRALRRIRSPNPSPQFGESPAIHYASRFLSEKRSDARRGGARVPVPHVERGRLPGPRRRAERPHGDVPHPWETQATEASGGGTYLGTVAPGGGPAVARAVDPNTARKGGSSKRMFKQ